MNKGFVYGNPGVGGYHRGVRVQMDTRDFEQDLDKFAGNSIDALRRGLGLAFLALMHDIIEERPKIPVLTSALMGSISVFVNKRLVGDSSKFQTGGENYRATTNEEETPTGKEQATLVVNAPYATIQHENFPTKAAPGAGMFFVLKKLVRNRQKYGDIVVNELRRVKT